MWDVNTCVMPTLVVCDMARELFCDSLVGGWWKAGNLRAAGLRRLQGGGLPAPRASLSDRQRNDCRQIHTLYDLGPVHILHLCFFVFIIFFIFLGKLTIENVKCIESNPYCGQSIDTLTFKKKHRKVAIFGLI